MREAPAPNSRPPKRDNQILFIRLAAGMEERLEDGIRVPEIENTRQEEGYAPNTLSLRFSLSDLAGEVAEQKPVRYIPTAPSV